MKLTKSLALLKASSTSVKVYLDFYILYVINSNLSVSVIMLYLHLLHYNKMELYIALSPILFCLKLMG